MIKGDLNLFAVFDTLYELRSVTRAAEKLNLTQSAVSHALRRLRQTIGDPLFVRSGSGLHPTERARSMAPAIRDGLTRLGEALVANGFDPASSERTFTIAATSYFCALLIPGLIAAARVVAPGVRIRAVPIRHDLLSQIDDGTIDLALGSFSRLPSRIVHESILSEELVWIAARDNQVARATHSHAELLDIPHIAFDPVRIFTPIRSLSGEEGIEAPYPPEQTVPAELHGSAQTPAIVYDAFTAIAVVAGSDLIALVPRQLAVSEMARLGICILKTREAGPGVDLAMIYRIELSPDPSRDWLRSQVRQLASTLGARWGRAPSI
jgi:DNA-binding transcriptional LysR family regulator